MLTGVGRACNYAIGTFIFVSICGWETCRRTRAADQAHMQELVNKFNERHGR